MTAVEPIAAAEGQSVSCTLIVTRRAHGEVLVLSSGTGYRLPSIEIPRWERPAPHINDAVRRFWGIEGVCLFAANTASGRGGAAARRSYVVEARDFGPGSRSGSTWIPAGDVRSGCLLRSEDALTLTSALAYAEPFQAGEAASCFVRTGWFEEVRAWVGQQVSLHGWLLNREWTQYAMGPDFALIRFDTTGPPVWFKAAGGAGAPEYATSVVLSKMKSLYLPKHLGENSEWKSWLMADAGGRRLDECDSMREWTTAASSLAALQIDSPGSVGALIAAGCHDLRTFQLKRMVDPFIAAVAELMAVQPPSPARVLTDAELGTVATRLREGCAVLESLPILPCLGHGDLNAGNIIVNGERAVFLDWAAAMAGHPFFSLEYLLALFRRLYPERGVWAAAIRRAYLLPWRSFCPASAIEQSLAWTPLLAPFAWALQLWRAQLPNGGFRSHAAKLLRSIARSIHGETALLAQRPSASNPGERR